MSAGRRYMTRNELGDFDALLRLAPEGRCQWCGRELPNRRRRLCSEKDAEARGDDHTKYYSMCAWSYTQLWYTIPRFRRVVLIRDNFTCQGCGARPTFTNEHGIVVPDLGQLHVDHITPFSKGGETKLENLQVLCAKCNLRKGANEAWVPGQEPEKPPVPLFDYAGVSV